MEEALFSCQCLEPAISRWPGGGTSPAARAATFLEPGGEQKEEAWKQERQMLFTELFGLEKNWE